MGAAPAMSARGEALAEKRPSGRRGARGKASSHPAGPAHCREANEAEQVLATLPAILIGISPEVRVTRWNEMAGRVLGCGPEIVLGRALGDCGIHWDGERVLAGLERCRREGVPVRVEDLAFARPGGAEGVLGLTINPVQAAQGAPSGFTIIGADITERKNLEKQLAQAQKLRSIGQLASGIAHEINTPTQYVSDNTRFLQDSFADLIAVLNCYAEMLAAVKAGGVTPGMVAQVEDGLAQADLPYLIEEIPLAIQHTLEGIDRISRIVRAMKEFAHPGREEKSLVDLNQIIETTITVARNEWKYVAEMVTDFDRSLPPINCLAAEINQVILNMIVNAAQAIEDLAQQGAARKGTIRVSTQRKGDWAEIRISDTGAGIPEQVRPRIFDPFFTTKEIGRGSGQGLAICYPVIVAKHGGRISFESEVGRGTTFTLWLPLGQGGE